MEQVCGNYTVLPLTVKCYETAESDSFKARLATNPKATPRGFLGKFTYIFLRDNRTGFAFAFIGTKRDNRLRFSDSRDKLGSSKKRPDRLSIDQCREAVGRLTGNPGLVDLALATEVKGSDLGDLLPSWRAALADQLAEFKARDSRLPERSVPILPPAR